MQVAADIILQLSLEQRGSGLPGSGSTTIQLDG